jgi:hypothetical protein
LHHLPRTPVERVLAAHGGRHAIAAHEELLGQAATEAG